MIITENKQKNTSVETSIWNETCQNCIRSKNHGNCAPPRSSSMRRKLLYPPLRGGTGGRKISNRKIQIIQGENRDEK
jgi:hypothetical protein